MINKKTFVMAVAMIGMAVQLLAQTNGSVTLAWDPNPEPDISHYIVYKRLLGGSYDPALIVTNGTVATVSNLTQNATWFFVVTAINTSGLESDYSNEVSATVQGESFMVRTLMATNMTRTNVTLVGYADKLAGEFDFYFEWSPGTNLASVPFAIVADISSLTNATNVTLRAKIDTVRTNYTYRLVATNQSSRVLGSAVTFSTIPPTPVRIRVVVKILQSAAIGESAQWTNLAEIDKVIPWPPIGNGFFKPEFQVAVEYDHDLPVPDPIVNVEEMRRVLNLALPPLP